MLQEIVLVHRLVKFAEKALRVSFIRDGPEPIDIQ
jgi:hypothetical protein